MMMAHEFFSSKTRRPLRLKIGGDILFALVTLSSSFQGIYTELEKNGGERVMCLLSNTMLPSRQPDSTDPWECVKESGYTNQPPLVQDDQILLVLRYPKTYSLLNRSIRGSMKSLNQKSNPKYFTEILVSSWLAASANYEFGSEKIVSRACDPYPYKDSLMNGEFDVYKGLDFCNILEKFNKQEAMIMVPNWKCNGTDDFCCRMGPFKSDREIRATDGSFKDVKLVIEDFRCHEMALQDEPGFRRISSVIRAVPPFEKKFIAAERTGLNNMTLSAEGIWKSSNGQLCMVGCLGFLDSERTGNSIIFLIGLCTVRSITYLPHFSFLSKLYIVHTPHVHCMCKVCKECGKSDRIVTKSLASSASARISAQETMPGHLSSRAVLAGTTTSNASPRRTG